MENEISRDGAGPGRPDDSPPPPDSHTAWLEKHLTENSYKADTEALIDAATLDAWVDGYRVGKKGAGSSEASSPGAKTPLAEPVPVADEIRLRLWTLVAAYAKGHDEAKGETCDCPQCFAYGNLDWSDWIDLEKSIGKAVFPGAAPKAESSTPRGEAEGPCPVISCPMKLDRPAPPAGAPKPGPGSSHRPG